MRNLVERLFNKIKPCRRIATRYNKLAVFLGDITMTLFKWSQTASANGTADSTCPFPEGMAPSAVNDGVRGAMAAVAKYRDDIAGLTATAGSPTGYTYSSYQGFDSLAHMNGAMIAFAPHATNGATVTINVDGLGAKPLRSAPGVELPAATIIQGTPYAATYNNSTGEWILHGLYGNPYNIPLLGGMDYWGTTAPNSAFIFPLGQALSRTTYAAAFAIMGTTYGAGDGSTTFNVPDKGERVSVMKVIVPTRLTTTYFGANSGQMGATGGGENQTLTQAQLPNVNLTASGTVTVSSNVTNIVAGNIGSFPAPSTGVVFQAMVTGSADAQQRTSTGFNSLNVPLGSGNAHPIVQPTIVCNYIMRII